MGSQKIRREHQEGALLELAIVRRRVTVKPNNVHVAARENLAVGAVVLQDATEDT